MARLPRTKRTACIDEEHLYPDQYISKVDFYAFMNLIVSFWFSKAWYAMLSTEFGVSFSLLTFDKRGLFLRPENGFGAIIDIV